MVQTSMKTQAMVQTSMKRQQTGIMMKRFSTILLSIYIILASFVFCTINPQSAAAAGTYRWYYDDNHVNITTGANNTILRGKVIQNPDAYGGRNVEYSIENSVSLYHVHLSGQSEKVSTVRYKAKASDQGNNIVVFNEKDTGGAPSNLRNLKDLEKWLTTANFPNHAKLFSRLNTAGFNP